MVVTPPRVAECPVQLEASLVNARSLAGDDKSFGGFALAIELPIDWLHVEGSHPGPSQVI